MAHTYTPGLRVTERAILHKRRLLPLQGKVHVEVGARVAAETVVASTDLPGKVHTVNVVNVLGIAANEIRTYMLKKEGDAVVAGGPIAENKPLLKWFKTAVPAPVGGKIENVSEVTGQVLLREPPRALELRAYVDGTIVEVIPREGVVVETEASFVQGIFGIGGEQVGEIARACERPDEDLTPDKLKPEHKDRIVFGGAYVPSATLTRAKELGVRGIVVGGFDDADLRAILGYDLGVAITGTENVGFTLILTEGFGRIAMAKRTFDLLASKIGRRASISGATQIRAGVLRPEIVIPLAADETNVARPPAGEREGLKPGDPIRLIRAPYFGRLAKVKSLPPELTAIATESPVRVLEAEFADGSAVTVPRANVEIIES